MQHNADWSHTETVAAATKESEGKGLLFTSDIQYLISVTTEQH